MTKRIYLEAAPEMAQEIRMYADQLRSAGYVVHSIWHERGLSAAGAATITNMLRVAASDILLIWTAALPNDGFVRLGFAMAAKVQVIQIGVRVPESLQDILPIRAASFDDISRNFFSILGSPQK
jgi:hypothetical protein